MIRIELGDCIDVMKYIKDCSIDMILCDLPYGSTQCSWDVVIPFDTMWKEVDRIIKDNGAILLYGNNPFSSLLISSNPKMYKYDWIIEKTHATGHLSAKKRPMKSHEFIHVFYKKPPTYNPQKTSGHKRKSSIKTKDKTEVYGKTKGVHIYDSTDRYPRSVLKFAWDKQNSSVHPTQKPVQLNEYMIKTYTCENETVLDFTMGSGTTGIACANTGRSFIGIELDETYFNIAKERINKSMNHE